MLNARAAEHDDLPSFHLSQDVPGVAHGTIPNRADGTLLKLIPKSEQGNQNASSRCSSMAGCITAAAQRCLMISTPFCMACIMARRHEGEGIQAD